ncbi:MAG: Uncharacterised protein [Flavobacteriia bacterium]|nr:MAG: Uncharacterised protein [Flavobacteriia bacterium]
MLIFERIGICLQEKDQNIPGELQPEFKISFFGEVHRYLLGFLSQGLSQTFCLFCGYGTQFPKSPLGIPPNCLLGARSLAEQLQYAFLFVHSTQYALANKTRFFDGFPL